MKETNHLSIDYFTNYYYFEYEYILDDKPCGSGPSIVAKG